MTSRLFFSRKDLTDEHHEACCVECESVEDDMIICCNTEKPCTVRGHLICLKLTDPSVRLWRVWYCAECQAADQTGGRAKQVKEEEKRAKDSWKIAEKIQARTFVCEKCSSVKCPVNTCNIQHRYPLLHGHSNELMQNFFVGSHILATTSKSLTTYYRVLVGHVVSADGTLIPVTIMCDTGAGLSLAEKSLVAKLGVESSSTEIALRWTNDVERTENDAAVFDVKFVPHGKKFPIKLGGLIGIDNLSLPIQSLDANELKRNFEYLRKLPLPSYELQKPQILLGLPHNNLICSLQTVKGNGSGPVAELCELGWSVGGSFT